MSSKLAMLLFRIRWVAIAVLSVPLWGEDPFVASGKLRILKIEPDGMVTERRSFSIVEARDRAGNRYTSQEGPQTKLVTLWLKDSGALYSIDFVSKVTRLLDSSPTPPGLAVLAATRQASIPTSMKMVANTPCIQQAINGPAKSPGGQAGEVCISQELGSARLYSKMDWTVNGDKFRNELEIVEVRRGAEPDPAWFQLPQGFSTGSGVRRSEQRQ